ncbi:MAG: RNA methyltransferase [Gammaproteobacteria bacterium]|nr:RNA methyltransferase [Gammaproteobacteria bacterium]NIR84262.1 RNA methyltransferase [Gammaproteobacteria bacterium]NIR89732.1 RNA methyltransferase [Gammaproteobacteria bacterium]NIU05420.1 RNA methyltransferase [Gammaproteobacteria bacterium]NIV52366.1 TrmJ/YjtD family RNA methyltransferase [Gammaproteobacteria bacterium]
MHGSVADRIRIVLVEPTHPGNIGAVARALKAMGLRRLWLVSPRRFPSAEATARAAGADDILHDAVICDNLDEALSGCGWVLATTARARHIGWPLYDPREAATAAVAWTPRGEVALVFGREHSGLTNAELDRCQGVVRIPTNAGFRSLNIASAVQVLAYELYLAGAPEGARAAPERESTPAATAEQMEGFYRHLEDTLIAIGYLDPAKPKRLMRRLRRLFSRARPDRTELDILRGILSAAQRAARRER